MEPLNKDLLNILVIRKTRCAKIFMKVYILSNTCMLNSVLQVLLSVLHVCFWSVSLCCAYFPLIARPGLLPDKAKFTVCSVVKLATIVFDETFSYWSAPKSS